MKNIAFLGIILLSAFLRLYLLSNVPPSASLDEASIGWNAYSILQTGKDEYGNTLPILLRAYDDYRPALYVYSVIPFVKIFGLNVVSVRLPSVIFSILTVIATYFVTKEMFKKQKVIDSKKIALVATLLLTISPWHIYISRLGHEVNLGLSFFVFAILFFLKRRIYLSTFFFVLSFISYQSEKIFIPVVLLGIFFIFKDELLSLNKKILIATVFSLIILTPFVKATLAPDALLRFKATNVFDANQGRYMNQSLLLKDKNDPISKFILNRRFLSLEIVTEGYLSHFNPVWLFTNPGNDKHKVPGLGLLYLWTLPFILVGLYILFSKKFDSKIRNLLIVWFMAAPLSASITTETPHALRSLTFLPTWEIFSSIGLVYFYSTSEKRFKKVLLGIFVLTLLFSITLLYKEYFEIFPKTQSKSFQYAISSAISYANANERSYKNVVFANNDNLYQSYMFFLFYTKYDPKIYLSEGGTKSGGYAATHKIGKYEFRPINLSTEKTGNLYIENYDEFKGEKQTEALEIFSNLDNDKAIIAVVK